MSKKRAKLLFFVIGWTISAYGCMKEKGIHNKSCDLMRLAVRGYYPNSDAMKRIIETKGLNYQDCRGNTLLHYCVWHENVTIELVDCLLKLGARLDIKNNDGQSVMYYHRVLAVSPLDTPEEGLIKAQSVPKREVMDFLFATEVVARLGRVDWERNMQERQKNWLTITYFR